MSDDKLTLGEGLGCGIIALIVLGYLAFWIILIYVAGHFVLKYW